MVFWTIHWAGNAMGSFFPYLVQLAYFNCYFGVVPSFGQLDQKRQQWHHNY
jgi:hypothetical protein